jgi:hypothetical protein
MLKITQVCSSRPGGAPPGLSGGASKGSSPAPAAPAGGDEAPASPKMPKGMPKGKGSMPKGMGMPGGGMSVERYAEAMEAAEAAGASMPSDCPSALRLKTSNEGKGGHMTYNADGVYVRAAACYIKAKFEMGG